MHIINKDVLFKNPEKVRAILEIPPPAIAEEAKTFIASVTYYGRFLPKLSTLLDPFYKIQDPAKYEWPEEHEVVYEAVKQEIVSDRNSAH